MKNNLVAPLKSNISREKNVCFLQQNKEGNVFLYTMCVLKLNKYFRYNIKLNIFRLIGNEI